MNNISRKIFAGIDDAGRGSIIGPLIIGGVAVDTEGLERLSELRIRDSKMLSPKSRYKALEKINEVALKISLRRISPEEIDKFVANGEKYKRLNYLEALKMAEVANELKADMIFVDASDVNCERFAEDIRSNLEKESKIFSEHHADKTYPIVSAASIVAKCNRDDIVKEISNEYGDFGSGYPSDIDTVKFLRKWIEIKGEYPPFSRKTWKTWKRIKETKLTEF